MDYAMLLKILLKYNASHNLILEDDVKPAKNALYKLKELAEEYKDFGFLVFYEHFNRLWSGGMKRVYGNIYGTQAWLFSRVAAARVADMLLARPWWYPVDLLIPPFVVSKLKMAVYERTPNLFQHVSEHSTYTGKVI